MSFDDAMELLWGHALGVLDQAERERALRLLAEDPAAQQWHGEVQAMVRAMPFVLAAQEPPSALKDKILSLAVRESAVEATAVAPGAISGQKREAAKFFTLRHEEGEWIETGLPGVSYKKLFADQQRAYITTLLRLQPGATYPTHQHGGYEECLVLEGDVRSGEVRLRRGDYQRMTGGSLHHALQTDAGCLLLIIASEENEMVPER